MIVLVTIQSILSLSASRTDCKGALGVSSGKIKDPQITASSSYDEQHQPHHARLNRTVKGSRGGWCSAFADNSEYLEIDLGSKNIVTGKIYFGKL